eukprot:XP_019923937.1 PREDICTED: uncharacterized protein LOC109619075 [Crassostrea gigas]
MEKCKTYKLLKLIVFFISLLYIFIFQDIFTNPLVEFKQSNLINPASVAGAFTDPEGEYDLVVNLAAETKYGQSDAVYQEGTVNLSMNCAREAAKHNVRMFVELSTGQVYAADKIFT